MNKFSASTFEDADVLLLIIDVLRESTEDTNLIHKLTKTKAKKILVLNKIDAATEEQVNEALTEWQSVTTFDFTFKISAKEKTGVGELFTTIKSLLPEGPEYYPKDQITDKPERFFISEIIRGKILELYHQEIPYSSEVAIEEFKESELRGEDFVHIRCLLYTSPSPRDATLSRMPSSA